MTYDVLIVGGGIMGSSTAFNLVRHNLPLNHAYMTACPSKLSVATCQVIDLYWPVLKQPHAICLSRILPHALPGYLIKPYPHSLSSWLIDIGGNPLFVGWILKAMVGGMIDS